MALGKLLAALALLAGLGLPALAQNPFQAVRTVNGAAITNYDISQRMLLLEALGAPGDVRALALEQLTEDRLRVQAGAAAGIALPDGAIEAGIEEFATQRGLTPEIVDQVLQARGIDRSTFEDFLEAGLIWREVVQARFRQRSLPSSRDLDVTQQFEALRRPESVLLAEIALPFAERGEAETLRLAEQLANDLAAGRRNFAATAREFSRTRTAPQGGDLGYVPAANLPLSVRGPVLTLNPGQVTRPIPISGGVTILQLRDIRQDDPGSAASPTTYSWAELIVPVSPDADDATQIAAEARATRARAELTSCEAAQDVVDEFGAGSGIRGPAFAAQVPEAVRAQLDQMAEGEARLIGDPRGILVVVLCARGADDGSAAREALRERIFGERITAFGDGYLQELLRDAIIIDS